MDKDFTQKAYGIFERAVELYHDTDSVDSPRPDIYPSGSIESTLFCKCWIDAVQWHLEDLIRDPAISPLEVVALKRRIDASNQHRTDMVEELDSHFRNAYQGVTPLPGARINTESPAWALDRLSILALKIWHMREQALRTDVEPAHREKCAARLDILLQQRDDLVTAIGELLDDIAAGRKYMKVYRQMKLYNDPATNPALYGKK